MACGKFADPEILYVGRVWRRRPYDLDPSDWRNPFRTKKYGLERSLRLYREHVLNSPELMPCLPELRGKILACFCEPGEPCHADILIELLEQYYPEPAEVE
jgi:hypothetical protein